jgi:hypothetical protein
LVKISEIPDDANMITSHVGSLKARIVAHGHLDDEKLFLRTDAPTMSVTVLRLFLSIATENDWRVGSLDIKAAYLQANGFSREIYVRPPQEEADILHPWKLEKPAYRLSDSGRLWILTSFSAQQAHDLQPCPYDKTIFKSRATDLFITTQVDNFLFTGKARAMDEFSAYMGSCFKHSELECDNFTVYGTLFARDCT